MTREEHLNKILELSDSYKYLMLKLPTSFGKSKVAIEIIKRHYKDETGFFGYKVLIVIPKLVLIDNWKDELKKWELPEFISVTFTTYVSLHKHTEEDWGVIIYDEGHHFTDNCLNVSEYLRTERVIVLSATLSKESRFRFREAYSGIREYNVTTKEAIQEGVLPDPKMLLIPMLLDNTLINQEFIKNKSKGGEPIVVPYAQRWSTRGIKTKKVIIRCTEQQYYGLLSETIDWWKNKYMVEREEFSKNQWLRLCKVRLGWLAERKGEFTKKLLTLLQDSRTLTFCTSIKQTEELGKNCIHSENEDADDILEAFNKGNIDHITACSMLDEGMNLVNCQIGIFANIGSSERVECQRLGRILRHDNPLIIIPYYTATREEEIVKKMMNTYNVNLIYRLFRSQVTEETLKSIVYAKNDTKEDNN